MTRNELICALDRIHHDLQALVNPAVRAGIVTHQEHMTLTTAMYHVAGLKASLWKAEYDKPEVEA